MSEFTLGTCIPGFKGDEDNDDLALYRLIGRAGNMRRHLHATVAGLTADAYGMPFTNPPWGRTPHRSHADPVGAGDELAAHACWTPRRMRMNEV